MQDKMDIIRIPDLLVEWGHPELVAVFQEEEFDVDAFLELDNESLSPYISKHGPRINFLKKLRQLKDTLTQESNIQVVFLSSEDGSSSWQHPDVVIGESSTSGALTQASSSSSGHSHEISEEVSTSPDTAVQRPVKRTLEELVLEDTIVESAVEKLDVKAILLQDSLCKHFLTKLETGQVPEGDWRNKIVDVLVSQSLLKISRHLSLKQLRTIAQKLVDVLPGENLATYYYSSRKLTSGKLVDKYNNLKAKCKDNKRRRPSGKTSVPDDPPASTSRTEYTLEERKLSRAWLEFNRDPLPDVRRHWEIIYQDRMKVLYPRPTSKKENNIEKYYTEFKVLKDNTGWQLLVADFDHIYPDKSGCLFSIWPTLEKAILACGSQLAKDPFALGIVSQLQNPTGITESAKILLHLMLIPSIFKTNTSVQLPSKQGETTKRFWKPSLAEVRDGFILHVKDASDVKKRLEARQSQMEKLGLKCQPLVVISGPTLSNFKHCQVSINGILYPVPGPLQAVDVAFKSFQVLNAWYPIESEQSWLFIQREIYKIITRFDSMSSGYITSLSAFQRELRK